MEKEINFSTVQAMKQHTLLVAMMITTTKATITLLRNGLCFVGLAWLLSACVPIPTAQLIDPVSPLAIPTSVMQFPKLVSHPKPMLPLIDTRPFSNTLRLAEAESEEARREQAMWLEEHGECLVDLSQSRWDIKREECLETLVMAQTQCDLIVSPDPLWGGLEPKYPLAHCMILDPIDAYTTKFFYKSGAMIRAFNSYVIYRADRIEEVRTLEELQARYAPITSANEALSYALVATGLEVDFRSKFEGEPSDYRFHVNQLENTFVKPMADGYQVLLFHKPPPCFTEYVATEVVTVKRDGTIIRSTPKAAYEYEGGLCVD